MFAALFIWTSLQVWDIERRLPPIGQFTEFDGAKLHYVDLPKNGGSLAPVLFVHGASGNLNDQRGAFSKSLEGQARLIFLDRPGHGYSDRGGADDPAKQAERYRQLLDELGIEKTVLVGHSLGSASVAAFAVLYPERVKGLLFLAPATHPWPGGVTWYYDVGAIPFIGNIFTETLSLPVGQQSLAGGAKSVFNPQDVPLRYVENSAIELMLRPATFRHNAQDVANLNKFVIEFSPRYKEIKAPTIVITGDKDDIVLASIHSVGLHRDIEGAELIILPGVGHKPDYVAMETAVDAIQKLAR